MVYRFEDVTVDVDRRELSRGDEAVSIGPRPWALLLHLIRHRHRVVSKRELLEKVWSDAVVTDASLAQCVAQLRRALAAGCRERDRLIATVYGRGYRFSASVTEIDARSETRRGASEIFVGRQHELSALMAAHEATRARRGRTVLLVGEAGMGKTRTAQYLAALAREAGSRVATTLCHAAMPPFWPWQTLLQQLTDTDEQAGAREWEDWMYVSPEELAASDVTRARLFDELARGLRRRANERPLVLVLDDLQEANPTSVELLAFLGRELADSRVLILGAWRDPADPRVGEAARVLQRLRSTSELEWIELGPLSREETDKLVAATIASPDPELGALLFARTGGQPLFATVLLDELRRKNGSTAADLGALALPRSVREMIRVRLSPVSERTRDVLECASVLGIQFDLALLGDLAELERGELLDALEEAVSLGLVIPSEAASRLMFAHGLVREVLYGALPIGRRMRLHLAVAELLETRHRLDRERVLGEIAHHRVASVGLGGGGEALRCSIAAGRAATRRLAFEDAIAHCERALALIESHEADEPPELCSLLVELSLAQSATWQLEAARENANRAAACAQAQGSRYDLARAVLALPRLHLHGAVDHDRIRLIEDALAALGSEPTPQRAELLADLANTVYWVDGQRQSRRLLEEVNELATTLAEPRVTAVASSTAHYLQNAPSRIEERMALSRTGLSAARLARDPGLEFYALEHCVQSDIETLDIASAERHVREIEQLGSRVRLVWPARCASMLAILKGDFARAEDLLTSPGVDGGTGEALRVQHIGSQLATLRYLQGRSAEVLPVVRRFVERTPPMPVWQLARALLAMASGAESEARAEFERVAAQDFDDVGEDIFTSSVFAFAAELCSGLNDSRRAAALYDRLEPYRGQAIVTPRAQLCWGAADRSLGVLAGVLGRWDESIAHLENALVANERLEARPRIAETHYDLARFCAQRGGANDGVRVMQHLTQAHSLAQGLGMADLAARCGAPQSR